MMQAFRTHVPLAARCGAILHMYRHYAIRGTLDTTLQRYATQDESDGHSYLARCAASCLWQRQSSAGEHGVPHTLRPCLACELECCVCMICICDCHQQN